MALDILLGANGPAAHRQVRSNQRLCSGGPVQPLIRDAPRVPNRVRQPRGHSDDAKRRPNVSALSRERRLGRSPAAAAC